MIFLSVFLTCYVLLGLVVLLEYQKLLAYLQINRPLTTTDKITTVLGWPTIALACMLFATIVAFSKLKNRIKYGK